MKFNFIIILLVLSCIYLPAQEKSENLDPKKGHINVQFVAGILNATPVGLEARKIRNAIHDRERIDPNYSGRLLPKTSAYVGLNVDYQFHRVGAIGFGFTYTPKGYWLFETDEAIDQKSKVFITVDYFEIPIFYKEYLLDNRFSVRFGPVINLAVISKNRTVVTTDGEKEKTKSRLGENGGPIPKEVVPGFEAAFSYGNLGGFHADFQFQYMGSLYKAADDVDLRSIIFKIGVGYTFSK